MGYYGSYDTSYIPSGHNAVNDMAAHYYLNNTQNNNHTNYGNMGFNANNNNNQRQNKHNNRGPRHGNNQRNQFGNYSNKNNQNKQRKKKKNKRGQNQNQQQIMDETQIMQQQQLQIQYNMNFVNLSSGFDFAVHDLNQQLKLIKKELSDLEKQIVSTDSKTLITENSLKQTNEEKKKILDGVKREKLVLQKSLDIYNENEDDGDKDKLKKDKNKNNEDDKENKNEEEYDDKKIREFWDKYSASLQTEVDRLRTKNMAASASADVMHKHLRAQLDSVRKQLMRVKQERENNRNKNMQFELEVIELTELV